MRANLLAFAAGSLLTSGAWLVGQSLGSTKTVLPALEVESRAHRLDDVVNRSEEETAIRTSSSAFVRKCGASEFSAEIGHGGPRSRVQIAPGNEPVIDCILSIAPKEGFPLFISFKAD
ncbi:MAG: hypothetical protein NBV68_12370 [Erythrobacter sp.]|uniref:hypothetical protein n=1 Tax=Erythrobacter sp. TaxID=1042 RepID=UPI0025EFF82C|nr:hypothetical protein [Erythrobacter sp.]MCM0000172.1 hypothetical protein [Erythrobacter sp.]